MAHRTRFPHLALPFAIVGAAGGWLSAGLLSNPLMRMTWPGKEWAAGLIAMVLAGGLTPETVAMAIKLTAAPIVDVSSGVESSPGIKDLARISAFIAAARAGGLPGD